jgi:hypothetical protein
LGQIVLVGAGVGWMWGGDACVALGGGGRRSHDQDEGDASVPTLHNPTPAPTGTKPLPRRHHTISTRKNATLPLRDEAGSLLVSQKPTSESCSP